MKTLSILLSEGKATGFSIWTMGTTIEKEIVVEKAKRGYKVKLTLSKELDASKEPLNSYVLSKYERAARELLSRLASLGFERGSSGLSGVDVAYPRPSHADGVRLYLRNGKIVAEKHAWSAEYVPKGWDAWATGTKTTSRRHIKEILKSEFSPTDEEISTLFSIIGKSENQVRRKIKGIRPIENGVVLEDEFNRKTVVVRQSEKLYLFAKYTFSSYLREWSEVLRQVESARRKLSRYVRNVLTTPEIDIPRDEILDVVKIRQTVNGNSYTTELPVKTSVTLIAADRISQKNLREFLSRELSLTKKEIKSVIDYLSGRGRLTIPFSDYEVHFSEVSGGED